jgi:hypothetical protein
VLCCVVLCCVVLCVPTAFWCVQTITAVPDPIPDEEREVMLAQLRRNWTSLPLWKRLHLMGPRRLAVSGIWEVTH